MGTAQQCAGDLWSTWAGQQPSRTAYGFDGYQWRLDGNVIAGATGPSYTPTSSDVGHLLTCKVTLTYPLLVVTVSATSAPATVFSSASLTQDVLGQTQALLAGASQHDAHKLKEIVAELTASLDPSLWVDGNHVDAKHGRKVFDRDREAAEKLTKLIADKHSAIPDATLQGLIDMLVHADRVLAEVALADATAASGNPHDLARAQKELAKAAADLASGHFGDAIHHYGKAWTKAEKAMR